MYYQGLIREIEWEEGKTQRLLVGSYRQAVVIHCSSKGRTKGIFKNGEHGYFSYVEIVDKNGKWIEQGTTVVPVLPDGRILMVIEERPPLGRYPHPTAVRRTNGEMIEDLGPCGSLEFPGGAIDPGESLTAGIIRELREETEAEEQTAALFRRVHPVYAMVSDLALRNYYAVVFLSGFSFSGYVKNDGGLRVVALTKEEIEHNIRLGVIASSHICLTPWDFYKEVKRAQIDMGFYNYLVSCGYLSEERVKIKKP